VLSNRKSKDRRGKVQLINGTSFWRPMRKSLGDKRREIPEDKAAEIVRILNSWKENEYSKIYPTTFFGYRKITVERPLRLNFKAAPERIERLNEQSAFTNLAVSKKKDPHVRETEEHEGRVKQEEIKHLLRTLPDTTYKNREDFWELIATSAQKETVKLSSAIKKAILSALSERDETAEICRDKDGRPEADPELRDTENVLLGEDIHEFFKREVKPHVPSAWINTAIRDHKDNEVGKVGYEINFNRYFYKYTPPRPLEEIEADIRKIEGEIMAMLREVAE
jgi:type I restriction enzyme M protein